MTLIKNNLIGATVYLLLLALSHSLSLDYRLEPVLWPLSAALPAIILLWGRQAALLSLLIGFLYFSLPPFEFLPFFGADLPFEIAFTMTALNYLRAEATVWLIRRFVRLDRLGASSRSDLIWLIVIAGPIGGALSMPMILPAFWFITELSDAMKLQALLQWWLAMSAGGAIFMPLLMVLFDKRVLKTSSTITYLSVTLITITTFLALLLYQKNNIQASIETTQQQQEKQAKALIEQQLGTVANISYGLAAAIKLKPDIDNDAFQDFATNVDQNLRSSLFNFLSWSSWVNNSERALFETQRRCQISTANAFGFVPSIKQQNYLPVTYLYPAGIADEVVCFDMQSEIRRSDAIERAFNTGEPQLTRPIQLANNNESGFILITPVMNNDKPAGIISAVISSQQIFSAIDSVLAEQTTGLAWLHVSPKNEPLLLYPNQFFSYQELDTASTTPLEIFGERFWPVWPLDAQILQSQFGFQSILFSGLGALIIVLIQTITFYLLLMNATIANEVQVKTKKLNEASEQAKAAAIAKSRFLANMSHEIRTPLNAILGYAELAKSETTSMVKNEYLEGIWSSSESLLTLVNDILDYSKIEAGKFELSTSTFSLASLTDRLDAIFSMQAKQKRLEFKTVLEAVDERMVVGDQTRILQILINLVSNAIKFTHKGSVKIQLTLKPMTADSSHLHIRVTDTGIGMNETVVTSIFDEFTQADSGIAKHYGGTGLGLSISKSLLKLMSGEIDVDSTVGIGTRFTAVIPLQMSQQICTGIETIEENTLQRRRILVVDDNEINLKVTESLLKRLDMTVITAASGQDAITIIQQLKPDLVFMDMQMPDMDGLQATRLLRNHYNKAELIIVGLSANADVSDHDACLAAGMNDHIAKPVSLHKLRTTIAQWATH